MHASWLPCGIAILVVAMGGVAGAEDPPAHDETQIVPESAKNSPPTEARNQPEIARRIVQQANAFREKQKRSPLTVRKELTATAESFARYMAKNHRYGHAADDRTPAERAEAQGYDYCIVRENIGYQFSTRELTVEQVATRNSEGWEESPEHRENLLDPDVTEIGAGVAQSADTGYYFAVQLLGRPKSAAIEFELTNLSGRAFRYEVDGTSYDLQPRQIRTHSRCRPPKVAVKTTDSPDEEPQILRPEPGDRYVVEGAKEARLRISRKPAGDTK